MTILFVKFCYKVVQRKAIISVIGNVVRKFVLKMKELVIMGIV